MIGKEQFHTLKSVEAVDAEIATRKDLIGQMVGRLYPEVLSSEIELLEEIKAKLE